MDTDAEQKPPRRQDAKITIDHAEGNSCPRKGAKGTKIAKKWPRTNWRSI